MTVRRLVTRAFEAIRDQFESWGGGWGLALPQASPEVVAVRVRVLAPVEGAQHELRLIGVLSQEEGSFVFRYDPSFVASTEAEPILAFPDLQTEYRSRELWPFFAVRIPPADRKDVREALARMHLRPDQTLEVLGTLAKRSISNAYRLDLAPASARAVPMTHHMPSETPAA
jgi:HipA-like protein